MHHGGSRQDPDVESQRLFPAATAEEEKVIASDPKLWAGKTQSKIERTTTSEAKRISQPQWQRRKVKDMRDTRQQVEHFSLQVAK